MTSYELVKHQVIILDRNTARQSCSLNSRLYSVSRHMQIGLWTFLSTRTNEYIETKHTHTNCKPQWFRLVNGGTRRGLAQFMALLVMFTWTKRIFSFWEWGTSNKGVPHSMWLQVQQSLRLCPLFVKHFLFTSLSFKNVSWKKASGHLPDTNPGSSMGSSWDAMSRRVSAWVWRTVDGLFIRRWQAPLPKQGSCQGLACLVLRRCVLPEGKQSHY